MHLLGTVARPGIRWIQSRKPRKDESTKKRQPTPHTRPSSDPCFRVFVLSSYGVGDLPTRSAPCPPSPARLTTPPLHPGARAGSPKTHARFPRIRPFVTITVDGRQSAHSSAIRCR